MYNENKSMWLEGVEQNEESRPQGDLKTEIAIIGGGITGLSTALALSEQGLEVMVFEAQKVGYGATGHTTAKVSVQHGTNYSRILKSYGKEAVKKYADASKTALKKIKETIKRYNIGCDYIETNSNVFASTKSGLDKLEREYVAVKKAGIKAKLSHRNSLPFKAYSNICIPNQGMFHPIKYLYGIARVLKENGISIYEKTRIVEIDGEGKYVLKTDDGKKVFANKVIIATKYPILNKKGLYFSKISIERSYIIAAKMPNIEIDGYYINVEKEVRSIRTCFSQSENLFLIAGANHETGEGGDTRRRYDELVSYAKRMDKDVEVKFRWSTQDCMSADKIPYIGKLSEDMPNLYISTAFNKWGMTHSMVSAIMLTNSILLKDNPWSDVFCPSRKLSLDAKKELIFKGVDVAGDYIKSVLPIKAKDFSEIRKGEGGVFEFHGDALGVYKNENGEIFAVNPKCKHLGCRLVFNTAEKTWDCPCHGSRYTIRGEVIEAPAVLPLDVKNMKSDEIT